MSSLARQPLDGIIRQQCKIVGGICLPEKDVRLFIDQFNHCYGPLNMKIDTPMGMERAPTVECGLPVGAGMYNPFKTARNIDTSP